MAAASNNGLVMTGLAIAVIGAIAIAVPVFTTQQTKDVAKVGDLKLTAKEDTTHVVPPLLGPAALGVGVLLLGAGLFARR